MADSTKVVWIPDAKHLFVKALIVRENGNKMEVRVEGSGQTRELEASKVEKVNPEQFHKVGDMAELTYLNEPSVVNNLSERWFSGQIYTYSGLFLVAVNPHRQLPIYDADSINQFKGKRRDEAEPHIYAVAEQAIRNMRDSRRDQSILITGESGAGKTENTKKAIQYLSSITNSQCCGIDKRILQTNPILEAFGNAQTIRNANSSRFGKFIKIQFDQQSRAIAGASIQWYLLEKSRVVTQASNERNYHVFYQLLWGAPEELKHELNIPADAEPANFRYLASGVPTIPGVDDAKQYNKLDKAFQVMGFAKKDVTSIMRAVAAVLLLGEIKYRASSADQGSVVDMKDVQHACKQLGVDPDRFVAAVLQPRVKTGREYVTQSRTADQALHTTNAIAKALYERLFGYIVTQLNVHLDEQDESAASIGVLDIAGFEIFETNSFEQLCINYTNEKLQQFFNHHMFVLEQEEYIKENVDWDYVDCGSDLQPTIDLIEQSQNPMSIFSCLNEESMLLNGSDSSFNEKLVEQWKEKNPKFSPARLGQRFKIQHYAQTVEYQTDGWMEKNKDPLSDAAESMLAGSVNTLIRSLFERFTDSQVTKQMSKSSLFRTVAQRHKEQLNNLMAHLDATHPHFVRCILPNTTRSPAVFENKLVLDQLRYNGVLEGIRIARSGFPNRLEFLDFCQRYRALAGSSVNGPLNSQQTAATILQKIGLDPSLCKVGLSKVFFRNGVLADLEHKLDALLKQQALSLQSLGRGTLVRYDFNRALHRRRAAKLIANCFRNNIKHSSNPWWQITAGLKPLLLSKEGMDNNRKDIRMQKLESSVHRLNEEKVELIEATNKVRRELITALKGKEKLSKELEQMQKDHREAEESHELAVTAARSRDEASSAALTQLSKQHGKLKESFDRLTAEKEQISAELEEKVKVELKKVQDEIVKLKSDHEKQLTEAMKCASTHEKTAEMLRASVKKYETEAASKAKAHAVELQMLQKKLKSSEDTTTQLKDTHTTVLAKLEEQLKQARTSHDETKKDLQSTKKQHDLLESKHKEVVGQHSSKTTELDELKKSLAEKSKELESTKAKMAKTTDWLGKAKSDIETLSATKTKLLAVEKSHKMLDDTYKTLEDTHKKLEVSHKELFARHVAAEMKAKNSENEIAKLKAQLAKSVDTEKFDKKAAELVAAVAEITALKGNLEKSVKSDELNSANSRIARLVADLDLANDNLVKLNGDLLQKEDLAAKLQKDHKVSKGEAEKLQVQLSAAKEEARSSATNAESLKDEVKHLETDLTKRSEEIKELSSMSQYRSRSAFPSSVSSTDDTLVQSLRQQLAESKKALAVAQTQSVARVGVSPTRKRFGNGDVEIKLENTQHENAELKLQISEMQKELDSANNQTSQYHLLRQKYEKLQSERRALTQDLAQLRLGRRKDTVQSREIEITKAQDFATKRLSSELRVMGLELARKERELKELESARVQSPAIENQELVKLRKELRLSELSRIQLEKAVHGRKKEGHNTTGSRATNIAIDSADFDNGSTESLNIRKRHSAGPLQNISNDRSVSGSAGLGIKQHADELSETVQLYKGRAAEYLSQLEKAELVIQAAVRAETSAKTQVEDLKRRLDRFESDNSSEVDGLKKHLQEARHELYKRDSQLNDLKTKANVNKELEREIIAADKKIKDLNYERGRLLSDKSRLESRLRDLLDNNHSTSKAKEEQIIALKKSESNLMREHNELRWKLEKKDRLVDNLKSSLTDADARAEQYRAEIDRLIDQDNTKEISLRRITRQISEAQERYLTAERQLEEIKLKSSTRARSRDLDQPAFI